MSEATRCRMLRLLTKRLSQARCPWQPVTPPPIGYLGDGVGYNQKVDGRSLNNNLALSKKSRLRRQGKESAKQTFEPDKKKDKHSRQMFFLIDSERLSLSPLRCCRWNCFTGIEKEKRRTKIAYYPINRVSFI